MNFYIKLKKNFLYDLEDFIFLQKKRNKQEERIFLNYLYFFVFIIL